MRKLFKGWLACWVVLAVAILVFGTGVKAMAVEVLALQEAGVNGGAITVVDVGADFSALSYSGTYGNYTVTLLTSVANNGASGSNVLSSVTDVAATAGAGSTTLNIYVSEQDYSLPVGPTLKVASGMGGTYGSETGFTGAATFQVWADSSDGLLAMPVPFTNGLQIAIPASGNSAAFSTGSDATGDFVKGAGDYSVTTEASFTTTGTGDMGDQNHVLMTQIPEPISLILLGFGFAGVGFCSRLVKPKG